METRGIVYRFGPFVVDVDGRRLWREDTLVKISRRAVDVLALLAAQAGQIVGEEALMAGAWADAAVTSNNSSQAIKGLRQELGTGPDG